MDSLNIQDYKNQLEQVCDVCRKRDKCVDKTQLCFGKKLAFNLAKMTYKKRVKKGLIVDESC